MIAFLLRWVVIAVAVMAAAQIVSGVRYDSFTALAVAALVLGIVNAILRPVLLLLTLPAVILSFGIATLFINAFLFWLVGKLVSGFHVDGFWAAFWGALIVSVISFFFNSLVLKKHRVAFYRSRPAPPPPPRDHDVIDI